MKVYVETQSIWMEEELKTFYYVVFEWKNCGVFTHPYSIFKRFEYGEYEDFKQKLLNCGGEVVGETGKIMFQKKEDAERAAEIVEAFCLMKTLAG